MITGANAGIGRATAHGLAQRGAAVIMACRNMTAAKTAAQDICRTTGNDAVRCVEIDLADLASVQRCAANVAADGVDVLINNAGGAFPTRGFTAQGFEQTFGVNYLGPYALTRVLLPHMSGAPRVINVSSLGHRYCRGVRWHDLKFERKYSPMGAYANAKLAQILFTSELTRRCDAFSAAVHPGFIASEFYDNAGDNRVGHALQAVARRFAKTPAQGAETSIYLASTDVTDLPNGGYWASNKPARSSRAARDQAAAQRLWQLSEELVAGAGVVLPAI
jgi:NAD(P)-dependent dehydrogenase (short-subunit alcohol dehydrogenase family)